MDLRNLQLDTSWGRMRLVGGSRAGEGTLVLLPQLQLALEPGRPHRALPPMRTVVVSHGHLDHIGGLGYWASQRFLNSMPPATALIPDAIEEEVRSLLATLARLEGGRPYEVEIAPISDGSVYGLRRDMDLHFFTTDHWVPTLGTRILWRKRRLRPELGHLPESEIARRRLAGEEVTREQTIALLSYCADSGPALFEEHPEVLQSEVVLVECSFFKPGDRDRAAQYGHTHLEDLRPYLEGLSCRHLVLLHASRRHRLREIEAFLDNEIRPLLSGELHHLNIDWD